MRILLALGLLTGIASAQNVPDAPLPVTPSAPATNPLFQSPKTNYEVPPGPASSKEEEFCHAPATGLFAHYAQPESSAGEARNYLRLLIAQTIRDWGRQLSPLDRVAAGHGHIPALRFAINADGSHSAPELTVPSGRDSLDAKALETIRMHVMFDPPPASAPKPFAVCMRFAYGVRFDPLDP